MSKPYEPAPQDPRLVPAHVQIEALKRIDLIMRTYPPHTQFTIIVMIVADALEQQEVLAS